MTAAYVTYEDLAKMKKEVLQASAPASILREVDASTKFRRMLSSDLAIGRALTGPQFIDTVSIQDGAVTADKLVANLVLSTTIIAGAESPADRIEITAAGIKAYGTVSATPNTQTLAIENDGDFTFGVSPNQIAFVASTGTLTIPAAVITSLTIAEVGSGVIGGNYDTSANTAKLRLSTSGIEAWNSAGAKTVNIDASNGNFTLSNDPAGANRISMSQAGIELWKSSNRAFYLQAGGATNSIEMLLTGPGAGEYIGMNPTDGFWLGASTYTLASTKFRVSPAGALQATSATISGAITATSGELQTLSVTGGLTISSGGVFRSGPTSGSRTEMDSTGFYQYGASGTGTPRARLLATGAGALGISTTYSSGVIQWDTAGALTLAGFSVTNTTISSGTGGSYVTMSSGSTAFSAGGATPGSAPFNVSNTGALTATSVTISGAVTASSLTITGTASFSGGTMTLPNGGSITSSAVNINGNSGGSNGNIDNMNVANLTIDGTLTLNGASAKIIDQDGSYWDQSGLVLVSSGSYGDVIKWRQSGTDRGSIYSTTNGMIVAGGSGTSSDGFLTLTATQCTLQAGGASGRILTFDSTTLSYIKNSVTVLQADTNNYFYTASRFYPGNTSIQSTAYLAWNGADAIAVVGGDLYAQGHLRLINSGNTGTGALPNPTNWIKVKDSSGAIRRIPTFADANTWAA
jgi:hypothetical protein